VFLIFRGANIKLHQMDTKTQKNTKKPIPAGITPGLIENYVQIGSEVKRHKTLEHINIMFEKKNPLLSSK
jgi:hypothetical protein